MKDYRRFYEEYGYVLNILPQPSRRILRRTQMIGEAVELIGERCFILLEAALKRNLSVSIGERLFLGRSSESKVAFILRRLSYRELSGAAQAELPEVVEKIVLANEERFVEFFNKSQPISPRMHALELIPGIGKKYMRTILLKRNIRAFESFKDLKERTGIPNPVKLITKRVLEELMAEGSRYRLFVKG